METAIVSMFTYLLLFNRCLTFRLTIVNNVVVTLIMAFHMLVIRRMIGDLFVLPMFVVLILYIFNLKREDGIWNIVLAIFSYTLLVIIDNMTHFVWSLVGFDMGTHWLLYIIVNYPMYLAIWSGISKKIIDLKNKEFSSLSHRIIVVVGADLILCMFIFVLHISITEQMGSSPQILFFSIIVYAAYFVLTFLMIIMIIRECEINAEIMMKQNSYDNLQEYMLQIEELYQNVREFRHDFSNIMASMSVYMDRNDMEGLKKYYDKQVYPMSCLLDKEKDVVSRLHNLEIIELKGLISIKINFALEMKIKVELEITEKIEAVNMEIIDLVRIMGILLDNAIEASQECEEPCIELGIIKMDQGVAFIVRNTYVKKDLDYSKLGSIGTTSKGERRGIGLYNIRNIINEYDNVIMDTEYSQNYFTQTLEIYG